MYKEGNVLNWASVIEPKTMSQAHKASKLPFLGGHLALMPDAHVGKGATVGSVIPTVGAVIPSAVGVDIGCFDAETEFLTPTGWVKFPDYKGGKVAEFDPLSGFARFVEPIQYIVRDDDELLHFKTKYGIDFAVTPDHRVLAYKVKGRDRRLEQVVISAAQLKEEHDSLKMGADYKIRTSFLINRPDYLGMDPDNVRVQVMTNADAWMDNNVAQLRLKKGRKVERAKELLTNAGIEFSLRELKDGVTQIRYTPPLRSKGYNLFWSSGLGTLSVIADEVFYWGGNHDESCFYTSKKEEADFMSYCFASTLKRSVMREDIRHDGTKEYRVYGHDNQEYVGFKSVSKSAVEIIPSKDGKSYCFTVPSGFLVVRRSGNVFTSGNCGMAAIETTFTSRDLPDSLDALHAKLGQVIPAGVGQGHSEANTAAAALIKQSRDLGINLGQKLEATAANQLGSLGSGNHFVEVCLDERDVVWLVLHSGSRGVGNKLGNIHIESAKGLMKQYFITLDDPDLAYLTEGTPEFDAYIKAMLWAQDYAKMNRKVMLDALVAEFSVFIGRFTRAERIINCHHNFCEKEHHNGKDMWVTRKGAVRARKDDWVIIPGSMGTRSYIGKGLANPSSYNSCSHGAGRVLSRSEARRSLDKETLIKSMEGKSWNASQADSLIDEDPRSYKDIDQVMEDQKDLVEIHHTLHQILNYKGV